MTTTDHRRLRAQRSVEAILDAAERLLERGEDPGVSAVAAESGVSRPTVYAHFPTREALLEALVERVVEHAGHVLVTARLDEGTPTEALDRLIASGWAEMERHRTVAVAAADALGEGPRRRAMIALHGPIASLIERGRAEGAFRTDLPVHWLLSCYFAVMHGAADDVRAGRLDGDAAVGLLKTTLGDLLADAGRA